MRRLLIAYAMMGVPLTVFGGGSPADADTPRVMPSNPAPAGQLRPASIPFAPRIVRPTPQPTPPPPQNIRPVSKPVVSGNSSYSSTTGSYAPNNGQVYYQPVLVPNPNYPWAVNPYASSYYGESPYYNNAYAPYGYGNYPYATAGTAWPYYQRGIYPFYSPVFIPAENFFGPQAMMRFMGFQSWSAPQSGGNSGYASYSGRAASLPPGGSDLSAGQERPDRQDRSTTSGRATDLAKKYIELGDSHFGQQNYADALDRYRRAGQIGPMVADGWFRQAFASAALGRYAQAVKAIKRGLDVNPAWADGDFHLADLYGPEGATQKKARLDTMLKAAEGDAKNADLLFLVGVHLHFDGQEQAASDYFKRAGEAGEDESLLKSFASK